jgi:hypothetical protein
MRKQRPAARGFPFECRPERGGVDRDQQKVVLPAKCLAAVSRTCSAVEKWM